MFGLHVFFAYAYQGLRNVRFFGTFNVLCFLETPVLRFALLPYYRRKSSGVFRTQASIYNAAFLWIYLTAYYFCNKSWVIYRPPKIVKLRWSKSLRLLQGVEILVLHFNREKSLRKNLLFILLYRLLDIEIQTRLFHLQ